MSKYIHFTEAQKQTAKQTDLAAFLRGRGEKLKRSGSEYEWAGHHITIRGNQFYDQYAQRGGTAVDFAREQYGLSYPEAVSLLLARRQGIVDSVECIVEVSPAGDNLKSVRDSGDNNYSLSHIHSPFRLPEANDSMRRVYAYLIKQRCIDRDVLYHFAHRGLIYEDAQYHNAVFVGTDKDGNPRHAHKKSTSLNDSSFRANQTGSEAAFSFNHVGTSGTVYAFEAPIDMLSFISLYPKDWQKDSYVALCSVADHALFRLLEDYPYINDIKLCLDNDSAGREAMERIAGKLHERNRYYNVEILLPAYKDWNEVLKHNCGMAAIPAEPIESDGTEEDECQGLQFS